MGTQHIWANKSLGQHFLVQNNIIQRICSDGPLENTAILEVGPGPAVLTQYLHQKSLPYFVIEKDVRFHQELLKYLPNDRIVLTDALEMNLQEFVQQHLSGHAIWLVSNLPYNVGVPLLIKFLQCSPIQRMTVMLQKEVGEKILGLKKSGSLYCLINNYFSVQKLCLVPPNAFRPPPKVESIVLSLQRRPQPTIPLEIFFQYESFLRTLFQFKRKQIKRVLLSRYKEEAIIAACAQLDISLQERAENLPIHLVQKLFSILSNPAI